MKKLNHRLAAASLVVLSLAGLSACAPLLFGGVIATGVVASDRRTTGSVLEDETIELKAGSRVRETLGERGHVNITSYNRQALLTGEVSTAQDKQLVEEVVGAVENVRNVVNELEVLGNSSLGQRSNDVFISTKVKASLLDAKDLYANAFKIVTERGTTYMLGRVTQREAQRATDIISNISGVQRVVRVLDYISEEELARLLPQKPKSADKPSN